MRPRHSSKSGRSSPPSASQKRRIDTSAVIIIDKSIRIRASVQYCWSRHHHRSETNDWYSSQGQILAFPGPDPLYCYRLLLPHENLGSKARLVANDQPRFSSGRLLATKMRTQGQVARSKLTLQETERQAKALTATWSISLAARGYHHRASSLEVAMDIQTRC
jgi:hypothetical protein